MQVQSGVVGEWDILEVEVEFSVVIIIPVAGSHFYSVSSSGLIRYCIVCDASEGESSYCYDCFFLLIRTFELGV